MDVPFVDLCHNNLIHMFPPRIIPDKYYIYFCHKCWWSKRAQTKLRHFVSHAMLLSSRTLMPPTKSVFMIPRVFGDRKGLPSIPESQFPEWSFCKYHQLRRMIQLDNVRSFQSSQNLLQQYNSEWCCAETCREAECKGRCTGTLPLLTAVKLKSCRQCLCPRLHGTGTGTSLLVRSPHSLQPPLPACQQQHQPAE